MSNRRVRQAKKEVRFMLREGARVSGDPNQIGRELESIYSEEGQINAEIYVKAAKDPGSALHGTLEWDNRKAGHQYRLMQARTIIRAIVVTDGEKTSGPVYVKVSKDKGYQPADVVVHDVDMFSAALTLLQRKLNESLRAVNDLKSAAEALPDTEAERMAKITMAVQALHTADRAVSAIH